MKKIFTVLILFALTAMFMPMSADWSSRPIALDPGHGGSDPGAAGPSAPHEAELALRCAQTLQGWVQGQLGGTCRMTRTSNVTVSLSARRQYSISWDPWIFCSIHLNAFNGSAHGTETWYYWSSGSSHSLANYVQSTLVQQLGRTNRGVKQNGWTVITGTPSVPAILTEALFVDNYTEWNMINNNSKDGFKKWARGHIYGFYDYLSTQGGSFSGNPRDNSTISAGTSTPPPAPAPTPELNVSTSSLYFECFLNEHPSLDFTVTGKNLSSNISVASYTPGRFTPSVTSLDKAGGKVTVKFNISDKVGTYEEGGSAVNSKFYIKVKSGKLEKTVAITAKVNALPLNNLTEKWNYSEKKGNKTEKGYDAGLIRNFTYNDGKLYCVYNHSDILVLNAQTGESLGTLNLGTVVNGGTLKLCDVKAKDGRIVACNLAKEGEELRVYEWANDQAEPSLLLRTTDFQGVPRIGDCIELSGSYDSDLWLSFGNDPGSADKDTKIIEYNRKNGAWTSSSVKVTQDGSKKLSTQGTTRVYKQPNVGWWIDGKDSYPTWVVYDSASGTAKKSTFVDTGESWGSCHHEFQWGGQKYSANIVFNGKEYNTDGTMKNEANYKGARMRLIIDEKGDFTRMQQVGDFPSAGLGDETRNINATADIAINTDGSKYFEAWVYSTSHGIAYYSFGDVPQHNPQPIVPLKPTIKLPSNVISLETFKDGFAEKVVNVNGVSLTGDITFSIDGADAAYFFLENATVSKNGGNLKVCYAPKAVGSHTARLTASSEGADDVVIELKGTAKTPTQFVDNIDALTEMWNKSGSNVEASWVNASENYIRNIAYQDGKIYMVLCKPWGNPEIKILDAYTGDVKGSLNMEGVSGGTAAISGIVAVGGKIFASNIATTAQVFRIYRWDSDGAAPAVALEVAGNGHATSAIGGQLSFSGDLNNGRFWSSDNGTNNLIYFNVSGGNINATVNKLALKNGDKPFSVGDGRGTASVQVASDGTLYVASKDAYPAHFKADGTMIEQLQASACGNVLYGAALNVFTFGSKRYAVAGTYAEAGSTKKGAFTLINITDGFAAAESPIGMYPAAGFSSDNANDQRLQSVAVSTRENGHVLDVWFATSKQGLGYYSYNGIKPADAVEGIASDSNFGVIADSQKLIVVGVEAADIELYNAAGMLVAKAEGQTVSVAGLKGLYIVKVKDVEGKLHAVKVAIK